MFNHLVGPPTSGSPRRLAAIKIGVAEHEMVQAGDAAAAANTAYLESIRLREIADRHASVCLQTYLTAVRESQEVTHIGFPLPVVPFSGGNLPSATKFGQHLSKTRIATV